MSRTNDDLAVEEPRSVILAVISAKNDLENQIVLNMAKEVDPTRQRTMGKPIEDHHPPIDTTRGSHLEYLTLSRQLTILYTQVSSPNLTASSVVQEMKSTLPL